MVLLKRFLVCLLVLGLLVVPVLAQFQVGGGFQIAGYAQQQQDGDYSGWLYYKILHVTGNTSVLPVGFQVNFTCWYGTGADSANNVFLMEHSNFTDMHDLRFVDADGWELDAWNETTEVGVSVDVWVELQSSLTVYVYYGNGLAPVVWDAPAVFERVVDSGVVLALPMGEGSGSVVYDYSGDDYDGTVVGADWVSDGQFGYALHSHGVDEVVYADTSVVSTNSFSLVVYAESGGNPSGTVMLFQGSTGSSPSFEGSDAAYWYYVNNNLSISDVGIVAGVPHVLCFRWDEDASEMSYFRDGVQVGITKSDSTNDDVSVLYLMASNAGASYPWAGVLSGAFLFNVSLSTDEVGDFADFYPQVFGNHLGSVYLREWVSGGCDVGVFGYEMGEVADVAELSWAGLVLFLVLGLVGFLMVAVKVPVINVIYGGVLMATVTGFAVGGDLSVLPYPYYLMVFLFMSGLTSFVVGVFRARG